MLKKMQAEEQSEDREEDDVVKVIMPSSNLYNNIYIRQVSELKLYNPKIFLYFVLYFYLT